MSTCGIGTEPHLDCPRGDACDYVHMVKVDPMDHKRYREVLRPPVNRAERRRMERAKRKGKP